MDFLVYIFVIFLLPNKLHLFTHFLFHVELLRNLIIFFNLLHKIARISPIEKIHINLQ